MKIIKEFVLREIGGEAILVPVGKTAQEFNGMITLTDTAKIIWQNLEKVDGLEQLVKIMTDEFDVEEELARRDCLLFIDALINNGFVETTHEDGLW